MISQEWVIALTAALAWFDLAFILALGMNVDRLRDRLDYMHHDVATCTICLEAEGDL